eukprot:GHVU01195832.1.p1 GENE.GHVU01195832.1~~GHVU01195832.1.p1  ORF type:complete len:344 (+),score=16.13 GHVU01195832.1:1832-2863(+)
MLSNNLSRLHRHMQRSCNIWVYRAGNSLLRRTAVETRSTHSFRTIKPARRAALRFDGGNVLPHGTVLPYAKCGGIMSNYFLRHLRLHRIAGGVAAGGGCAGAAYGAFAMFPMPTDVDTFLNPRQRKFAWILAANTGVFALWHFPIQRLQAFMAANFLSSSLHLGAWRLHTLVTAGFSHRSFTHFLLNMYTLNVVQPRIANYVTDTELSFLYMFASAASVLAHVMTSGAPVLGASGAVSAFIVVEAMVRPRDRYTLMFPFPGLQLTAAQLCQGLFATNLFFAVWSKLFGHFASVAWSGHLGGMVAGWLFCKYKSVNGGEKHLQNPWNVFVSEESSIRRCEWIGP